VESVHVFHHVLIRFSQFLQPAACLTGVLKNGVGANDCNAAGTNGLMCLPKHGELLSYFFCLLLTQYLKMLGVCPWVIDQLKEESLAERAQTGAHQNV
jgi:hypothetical protein